MELKEIKNLERLLNKENYLNFMERLGKGEIEVPDFLDLQKEVGLSPERFGKVMRYIGKVLWDNHKTVIYPLEMIVIPRFPFTKIPMIKWGSFKEKKIGDYEVEKIKDISSNLGNLINSGFLLRNFVLIDIDTNNLPKRVEVDTKSKRGYHKLFYLPEFDSLLFSLGSEIGSKVVLNCNKVRIEVMSGSNYLGSYPPQSRFLYIENGKINVGIYQILSRDLKITIESTDLSLLKSRVNDVKEYIDSLLKEFGCDNLCKTLSLKPIEKEPKNFDLPNVNPKKSKFNEHSFFVIPSFSYKEFKELMIKEKENLPYCLRQSLFSEIKKGHRYFHLRFLIGILPFFVYFNKENVKEIIKDFGERTKSKQSEIRQWLYHFKYFSGEGQIDGKELRLPSLYGVPEETWSDFQSLKYCETCLLRKSCLEKKGKEKRNLIVNFLYHLIERKIEGGTL